MKQDFMLQPTNTRYSVNERGTIDVKLKLTEFAFVKLISGPCRGSGG
jgi:hypothetical protein